MGDMESDYEGCAMKLGDTVDYKLWSMGKTIDSLVDKIAELEASLAHEKLEREVLERRVARDTISLVNRCGGLHLRIGVIEQEIDESVWGRVKRLLKGW